MLLDAEIAMIFGAGGAIGGAVAKTIARAGARVFLSGHNGAAVEAVPNHFRGRCLAVTRAARPPLPTANKLLPTAHPASAGHDQDPEVH